MGLLVIISSLKQDMDCLSLNQPSALHGKDYFPRSFFDGFIFFSFIISAKLRTSKYPYATLRKYLFSCRFYSASTLQILDALSTEQSLPIEREMKRWSNMCPKELNRPSQMMW